MDEIDLLRKEREELRRKVTSLENKLALKEEEIEAITSEAAQYRTAFHKNAFLQREVQYLSGLLESHTCLYVLI